MKAARWYRLGHVDPSFGDVTRYVRFCKAPQLTREYAELLQELNEDKVEQIFIKPFLQNEQ